MESTGRGIELDLKEKSVPEDPGSQRSIHQGKEPRGGAGGAGLGE